MTIGHTTPCNHLYKHKYSISPSISPRSHFCDNQAAWQSGQTGTPATPATLGLLLLLLRRTGQAGSVRYPRESRTDGSNGVLLLPRARLPTAPTALGRQKSLAADPGKLGAHPQHGRHKSLAADSGKLAAKPQQERSSYFRDLLFLLYFFRYSSYFLVR